MRAAQERLMKWIPHDASSWGLFISILALILAFPLSLLANLLTPRIRNWWAERSINSLTHRIADLEKELAGLQEPVISDGEDRILRAVTWIGAILTQFVGFFMLFALDLIHSGLPENYLRVGSTLVLVSTFAVQASIVFPSAEFLRKRSQKHRERLKKGIEGLKARLVAKKA